MRPDHREPLSSLGVMKVDLVGIDRASAFLAECP